MHHAGRALAFSLLMWPSALAAADPPLPGGGREPDLHAAGPPFPSPKAAAPPDRDRPVSRREIEALRREIIEETRSSLALRFDVHEETGDLNNKLDFLRFGARLDLKWRPSTTVSLGARRTPYRTPDSAFRSTGTEVTLGLRRRDSPRREWQVEGSVARFGGRDWSVTGLASATFHPSEAFRWSVDSVFGVFLPEEDRLTAEEQAVFDQRQEARRSRDFARADELRKQLESMGIGLEDSPKGTRWRRKR